MKSAKQLTQQPVWVREGYRFTYYPYDRSRHRTDFAHEAGLLLPIQKLEIKDVVTDTAPHSAHLHQVMAVFELDGKTYAVPIGSQTGDSYQIYSDEMFFIQDPHELYKHWPADVWAIHRATSDQARDERISGVLCDRDGSSGALQRSGGEDGALSQRRQAGDDHVSATARRRRSRADRGRRFQIEDLRLQISRSGSDSRFEICNLQSEI